MFKFGIDWSEQHHTLCIRNDKGAIVSQVEFKHTLEGFQRFDDERRKLGVPPSECLVAIETAYNLLVDFLLDRGYLVYLISPQATKGYRNRLRSTDAQSQLGFSYISSDSRLCTLKIMLGFEPVINPHRRVSLLFGTLFIIL